MKDIQKINNKLSLNRELSRVVQRLVRSYKPERIILFGSMVSGHIGRWSDIDLAIVKRTRRRFLDRLGDALLLANPKEAMDVLVYTPEEVESMEADQHSFWTHEIKSKGKILYQRH
jgi:predicted nucleotidyltransferase